MSVLTGLAKDKYFDFFEEISNIPRGSANEQAMSQYLVDFAQTRGLVYRRDEKNNVLIKKPASKNCEGAKAIILQGHVDMVCEKESDVSHDFLKEPLKLIVDGDFIYADGTTLGADNGVAVAYMLALLDGDAYVHPPIEAIFTVEEEIGMGGAAAFDTSDLEGRRLINLDTEEEGVLLVSCSGGRRVKVSLPVTWERLPTNAEAYRLGIHGLNGGHSGQEIHLQRANAHCLMGRLLDALREDVDFSLVEINGGRLDNVICREAEAIVLLAAGDAAKAGLVIKKMEEMFLEEYNFRDSSITIDIEPFSAQLSRVMSMETRENLIDLLMLLPYGVQTMTSEMSELVESSTNIGVVATMEDTILIENAVRSSVSSRKEVICNKIALAAKRCGAVAVEEHDYPGWKYNPDSVLLGQLRQVYQEMTEETPSVSAVHAGLECGLFGEKIDGLDMISIGPEMYDVHTPKERLCISSTIRTWAFLLAALARLAQN